MHHTMGKRCGINERIVKSHTRIGPCALVLAGQVMTCMILTTGRCGHPEEDSRMERKLVRLVLTKSRWKL